MVAPYFSRDFKANRLPKYLKCRLYIDGDAEGNNRKEICDAPFV